MCTFVFNEGQLELPDGWEDKSVIALSFPKGAEPPEASFTITRDSTIKNDVNLATYVDKNLQTAKSFPKFNLIRHGDTAIDNEPAEQIEFTWRTPDKHVVHQLQTILIIPGHVALSLTATAKEKNYKNYEKVFQSLLNNLKIRR